MDSPHLSARILKPTPEALLEAVERLLRGDVIGMPTETVYGLAGNALDETALASIFSKKERPTFDPLIVHVFWQRHEGESFLAKLEELDLIDRKALSPDAVKLAEQLMSAFWPGPLTLVLPKSPRVPDLATSGLNTVALRMPRHPVARALLAMSGLSLAAPSANRFGRISPTRAEHVASELGDRIELILDGGDCAIGVESTVMSISMAGELRLLRPGGVAQEEIEGITGLPLQRWQGEPIGQGAPSPGLLERHYSPNKPFRILPSALSEMMTESGRVFFTNLLAESVAAGPIGLLLFQGFEETAEHDLSNLLGRKVIARTLSRSGSLEEAAKNLFSQLRSLDESDAVALFAEPCPETRGLGYAIGDRLMRASQR